MSKEKRNKKTEEEELNEMDAVTNEVRLKEKVRLNEELRSVDNADEFLNEEIRDHPFAGIDATSTSPEKLSVLEKIELLASLRGTEHFLRAMTEAEEE